MHCIIFLLVFVFSGLSCAAEVRPVVVVTCATGEIGQGIAQELAASYTLVLTGRDEKKLKFLKDTLGNHVHTATLDYSDKASVMQFTEFLESLQKPLYAMVLITPRPQISGALPDAREWQNMFDSCFTGPLDALKGFLSHKEKKAKIVVIAGTTSVQLQPEYGSMCVLRRMWTTEVKAMSHALGKEGVYVNAVSPGVVLTEHHKTRIADKAKANGISFDQQMLQEVKDIPLQRFAEPSDVAKSVSFLLSSHSDNITGVNLVCDGGKTVSY